MTPVNLGWVKTKVRHKLHEKWLDQLEPDRLFIELNLALNKQTG